MMHTIILAAGQGTRMRSSLPKVLHPLAGKPLLQHVLDAATALEPERVHVVYGHGGETLKAEFSHADVDWALQAQQLGTGHAVMQAMSGIGDEALVLVLFGDVPLVRTGTLRALVDAAAPDRLALLTVELGDPTGYGRILRDERGAPCSIVEEKDATPEQRAITEVNTGLMAARAGVLRGWLARLGNDNAQGEYYLTDTLAMAVTDGVPVIAVQAADASEVMGVNNRSQLAQAERVFQRRGAEALMRDGLALADPARFDVRGTLVAGQDCEVDVGCVFEGRVTLADRVRIGAHCVIRDCAIGPDSVIEPHSVLDGAEVGAGCTVGPFARLRPGTRLGARARVGNFVETKKADIGAGSKLNHLSYIGDARVGARVNIGAGVITCNYDGVNKHTTVIGDGAFIGTDSQLVAPVTVGDNAFIAAGSTITRDAPAGQLTVCRAKPQRSIENWTRPVRKSKSE